MPFDHGPPRGRSGGDPRWWSDPATQPIPVQHFRQAGSRTDPTLVILLVVAALVLVVCAGVSVHLVTRQSPGASSAGCHDAGQLGVDQLAETDTDYGEQAVRQALPCSDDSPEALQRDSSALFTWAVSMQDDCLRRVSDGSITDPRSWVAHDIDGIMDVPISQYPLDLDHATQGFLVRDGIADAGNKVQTLVKCNHAYQHVKTVFNERAGQYLGIGSPDPDGDWLDLEAGGRVVRGREAIQILQVAPVDNSPALDFHEGDTAPDLSASIQYLETGSLDRSQAEIDSQFAPPVVANVALQLETTLNSVAPGSSGDYALLVRRTTVEPFTTYLVGVAENYYAYTQFNFSVRPLPGHPVRVTSIDRARGLATAIVPVEIIQGPTVTPQDAYISLTHDPKYNWFAVNIGNRTVS